jgi:uncharacterized protein YjiS (DUF1127 family)
MLSSRLLNHVCVSRVSQTIDYKRGVNGSILSSHLLQVYNLWFDSHGTRTHDLTDARRAWYPFHHIYSLWFNSHVTRTHHLTYARRACYHLLRMLSSHLLNDVFVSRVSQAIDYKSGVNSSMLSLCLLNDVFLSPCSTFIVYGLNHTAHEHMI